MDPLQSKEIEETEDQKQEPVIIATNDGEMRIQLEGSHTTSTETEAALNIMKKNVKFQDEKDDDETLVDKETSKENIDVSEKEEKEEQEEEQVKDVKKKTKDELSLLTLETSNEQMFQNLSPELSQETVIDITEQVAAICDLVQKEQMEISEVLAKEKPKREIVQNITKKSEEISKHFEKIIEMFDNVTKNLENFELATHPQNLAESLGGGYSRKRPKSVSSLKDQSERTEEPQKHRSRYDEYYKESKTKSDHPDTKIVTEPEQQLTVSASTSCAEIISKNLAEPTKVKNLQNAVEEQNASNARSISTATSICEVKSLGCQTQISDHISLNEMSIMEGSSITSRSEQPNSLSNYAQAEMACVSHYGSQPQITKQPMPQTLIQQTVQETPPVVYESPTGQRFNVITIEANAIPSGTDLGRPPFCHRLWEVIGDFCAATLLCLQVNRDCIFCIGFFAAFVVSASFLTAFFYHTLIVNPTLWQVEEEIVL